MPYEYLDWLQPINSGSSKKHLNITIHNLYKLNLQENFFGQLTNLILNVLFKQILPIFFTNQMQRTYGNLITLQVFF